MLYDLIPLPMRFRSGSSISSVIPVFHDQAGEHDDLNWLGWELDLDVYRAYGCCKYKTIEIHGANTIERTFITYHPLDLEGAWWLSEEPAHPILKKVYVNSGFHTVTTYKYLDGITAMLQLTGLHLCRTQTVHNAITTVIQQSNYEAVNEAWINAKYNRVLDQIVVGDDEANLNQLAHTLSVAGDPSYLTEYSVSWSKELKLLDPWDAGCVTAETSLKALNLPRDPTIGLWLCSQLTANVHPPFDPTASTVKYDESDQNKRWRFLSIVMLLQAIPATDYVIQLTLENNKVVTSKQEFYNRYKGYGHPKASIEQASLATMLFEAIARWHHAKYPDRAIQALLLQRNWLDEAYLQLTYTDGEVAQYYIDFTMYQIASLCVIADQ